MADPCPLSEVFKTEGGGGQGDRGSDEDKENEFATALSGVLNTKVG